MVNKGSGTKACDAKLYDSVACVTISTTIAGVPEAFLVKSYGRKIDLLFTALTLDFC